MVSQWSYCSAGLNDRTRLSALFGNCVGLAVCAVGILLNASAFANQDLSRLSMPDEIHAIVRAGCMDCHSGDSAEADVRFDNFATLTLSAKLEVLNKAQDQIFFGLMPPETHQAIARANRVRGVVVVQPGQSIPDNQWNLDISATNRELYRGVLSLAGATVYRTTAPLMTESGWRV